jgi:hypothetical protein
VLLRLSEEKRHKSVDNSRPRVFTCQVENIVLKRLDTFTSPSLHALDIIKYMSCFTK